MQELLEKLISFQTTEDNPEEIKRGFRYIESLFDKQIYEVQWFEKTGKYSLLISFKGKNALQPRILLNGHFDVVPAEHESQYEMRVEGDKAYGRGVADMKGSVAVLISVMKDLGAQENKSDVALLLNADEEIGGMNGMGYMVREVGIKPGFVLCGDGGAPEIFSLVLKEKGIVWLELHAQGKSGHGAHLWEGENAIEKLLRAIQTIKEWVGPMEPEAWKTTVNFSIIETSNKTPNKVPPDAKAVLDIRFTEAVARNPEELLEKIKSLVPEIDVRALETGSALFVEEENEYVRQFKKAAEEVTGKDVPFIFEHGATDARYFGEIGVPAVIFGAIGGGWHGADEWIELPRLEEMKRIIETFIHSA